MANPYRLVLILDRASVDRAFAGIRRAKDAEAAALVKRVAESGAKLMRSLELGAGHHELAQGWMTTAPYVDESGNVSCLIYSEDEDRTFQARSGLTGERSPRWSVRGSDLLTFLEYGVGRHAIRPRRAWENVGGRRVPAKLRFTGYEDEEGGILPATDYVGTAITGKGVQGGFLDNRDAFQTVVRTDYVDHPGFAGYRFLHTTQQLIEMHLNADADLAARNIAARVGG